MIKLDSVSEQTEQGLKSCPFCDFHNGIGKRINTNGDDFIIAKTSEGNVYIATDNSHFFNLDINFCPMCGRKFEREGDPTMAEKEYIEREAVINALNDIGGYNGSSEVWSDGWNEAINEAINVIKNIPAADVAPVKHGEWCGTICSACGESTSFYYDCDYCPHCGAEMDGGEQK